MTIPITEEQVEGTALTLRNEETVSVTYDLSQEGEGEYADMGDIHGRFVLKFDINRGELLDLIDRMKAKTLSERVRAYLNGIFSTERRKPFPFLYRDLFNKFWEEWEFPEDDVIELDYGTVVLIGTEPIDGVPEEIDLTVELPAEMVESESAKELRREVQRISEYSVAWSRLENDIENYLQKEGVNSDVEFVTPVYLQARAEPFSEVDEDRRDSEFGTEFTITVKNNRQTNLACSELYVSLPSEIGREIRVPKYGDSSGGEYDPSKGRFEFDVPEIGPESAAEIIFRVPETAKRDLTRLEGKGVFTSYHTFSNVEPYAVFDSGGNRVASRANGNETTGLLSSDRDEFIETSSSCSYEVEFSTTTDAVFVSGKAEIEKRIKTEGVAPPAAAEEIEKILRRRGIEAEAPEIGPESGKKQVRGGVDVWTFNVEFERGSVVVDNAEISIGIKINGERRAAKIESQQTADDEMLPERRQSMETNFGKTGVTLTGQGTDADKVDEYITDLRNDIKTSLEALAEGKMKP